MLKENNRNQDLDTLESITPYKKTGGQKMLTPFTSHILTGSLFIHIFQSTFVSLFFTQLYEGRKYRK
jgi:hypothetical protein